MDLGYVSAVSWWVIASLSGSMVMRTRITANGKGGFLSPPIGPGVTTTLEVGTSMLNLGGSVWYLVGYK